MTSALEISPLRKKYGIQLVDQHAARLEAAGITPEMAEARGYRSITTKADLGRRGFTPVQRRVPGLFTPGWGVHGKPTLFSQYRPDEPRLRDGKQVKYEAPRGARMRLDVHPFAHKWLGDPAKPLFFTEGVLKGDALVARGLTAVALPGVWGWRGTNAEGGRMALPDFEWIALNDRQVLLAFDSDVVTKREVHQALRRFREFLEMRDAIVRVIYLPPQADGTKQGVDDYLAAGHSVEELLALASEELREAEEAPPAPAASSGPPEPVIEAAVPDGPPPDLDALLYAVAAFMRTYVVYSDVWQQVADTLWITHTHGIDAFNITAYLYTSSPVWQSGKTVAQEARARLVRQPWGPLVLPSEAVVFRKINRTPGLTLLLDETDAIFSDKTTAHEGLRALLNSGNRRGATVPRCVGEKQELVDFSTFCAKSLSGLGPLPVTLADRSIPVRLQRATPGERKTIRRFRYVEADMRAAPIRGALVRWAKDAVPALRAARPAIPEELDGRQADAWEPLFAVADAAGGDWPALARAAAVALHGQRRDQEETVALALLRAVRDVFEERGTEHVLTADLLAALIQREDGPWAEWWGRDVEAGKIKGPAHRLARLLAPFDVEPEQIKLDGDTVRRGYRKAGPLEATFERYHATMQAVQGFSALHGNLAVAFRKRLEAALEAGGSVVAFSPPAEEVLLS